MGAINRAASQLAHDEAHGLGIRASVYVLEANGMSNRCLPQINDTDGHAVIVAMFQRSLR
jgi:hypothetical protein